MLKKRCIPQDLIDCNREALAATAQEIRMGVFDLAPHGEQQPTSFAVISRLVGIDAGLPPPSR
jgi:hypothetical protein